MEAGLEFRHQMTREFGPRTLDTLIPYYRCASCGELTSSTSLITIGDVPYTNSRGLVEHAGAVAKSWVKSRPDPPGCQRCKSETALGSIDYHAYHSGADKDLVVRCGRPSGLLRRIRRELLWWALDDGYEPIQQLSPDEEVTIRTDALLRSVAAALEVSGAEAAAPAIERAVTELPGASSLMEFVPQLLQVGKSGLAGAIVESRLAASPDDPDAHFWMAEIVIQVVAHGAWPTEKLSDAEEHLGRALALRAPFPEAETARCNLLRLRGDQSAARECFLQVVSRYPDRAEAHFNLGIMALDFAPEEALAHFARGEAISPEDADYPLGSARALIRLGRTSEATEALSRAEGLDPEHPKLAEIRDALS